MALRKEENERSKVKAKFKVLTENLYFKKERKYLTESRGLL